MCDLTELVREAWRNACENGYEQTLRAMRPNLSADDARLLEYREFQIRQIAEAFGVPRRMIN